VLDSISEQKLKNSLEKNLKPGFAGMGWKSQFASGLP
jgi:hypothetical protein